MTITTNFYALNNTKKFTINYGTLENAGKFWKNSEVGHNAFIKHLEENQQYFCSDGKFDEIAEFGKFLQSIDGGTKTNNGDKSTADGVITDKEIDDYMIRNHATLSKKSIKKDVIKNTIQYFLNLGKQDEKTKTKAAQNDFVNNVSGDDRVEQTSTGYFRINIEPNGTKGKNGKLPNTCPSNIISNYYPDVELYSDEYNKLLSAMLKFNGLDTNLKNWNNGNKTWDDKYLAGKKISLPVPVIKNGVTEYTFRKA